MADDHQAPSKASSPPEFIDEHDIKKCITEADELKREGNESFRASRWSEALVSYRTALSRLPRRKKQPVSPDNLQDDTSDEGARSSSSKPEVPAPEEDLEQASVPCELEAECCKARAVLNANIGACLVKLGDYSGAVESCTQSLLDDPHYIKALQRRAASNEQLDSWSSLTQAQEDYKLLLELLPPTSPQVGQTRRSLQLLEPRQQAAQKKEMAEMTGKLKNLGNSILGNFGLSTDNFKFEPNGQGGYSMNFVR
ncbi:TPR-like protein [Rhizopogon vinicolor AM-OR11-026]|uniref:TPR-like protein n=1 Tax=Rhizopogon vinicolor AM-OR11-026 TaxID=1314800 RepID=A0A1B7NIW0_9AGAM|nr:TPR-like protein [Rhizopogon vinicolor AM-OR11-026]